MPSLQHSPIFGQLPEVQIVCRSYLSTRLRNSVYFLPVGSLTLSHFGFPLGVVFVGVSVSVLIAKISFSKIQYSI
ncbi:hypothetical protein ZPR_3749 [Zunongwangia profunda SM-A87]|uniref:Uncharacterized protein n=1 Tax=Zunongwangia profunda (strain DSM 18752 / CCTCC AB 206139 / SM-A87) TaxID=655815 RepID=D5BLD0_ZUNPS|nr:hypothetical protein ZPR_3749 [Zunongwangia profunda SM-A87]